MKKQLFILSLFVLTFFAGIKNVSAQDALTVIPTGCASPTTITCLADDALHPIPGKSYEYGVDVPTPSGVEYTWFVTQDKNFITTIAGTTSMTSVREIVGQFHIAATGIGYNDPTIGTRSQTITWNSFIHDPTNPVFVVIYVETDATVACTTDNIQVYMIQPVHAFTLDLANLDLGGTLGIDGAAGPCAAPVAGAVYDPTLNANAGGIAMDYGTNYLFFNVTAANYTGAWKPGFEVTVPGVAGSTRSVTAVDWAYTASSTTSVASNWHGSTLSGTATSTFTSTDPVLALSATKTVGAAGECIVVRVTIANGNQETLTPDDIEFAVDGIVMLEATPNSGSYVNPGLGDIHYEAGGTPSACPWYDGFINDHITQQIMPRPTINSTTPGVTPNPDPGLFIQKN